LARFSLLFRKSPPRPRSREEVVSAIESILGYPGRGLVPYRSGIWNGLPGWMVGRQIFRQVVLGNWPHLEKVSSPADIAFAPPPADADRAAGYYPEIVPTDETFHRYIQVLAEHSLEPEIPLALAWMQALKIVPRRTTLAMALVYWGEFSLGPPLVERWSRERSDHAKLRDWLSEWVPPESMPGSDDIAQGLKEIASMRRGRNPSLGP
jgi:hypothetical protein